MSSSAAATPAASSSASVPSSAPSSVAVGVGCSVGLVVLVVLGGLAFWLVRRRRWRAAGQVPPASFQRNPFVALSDPASRVTPFNSPGRDVPRFVHQPGENMRIAHRRSDGGWEFSNIIPDNASTADLIAHRPSFSALSTRSTLYLPHKDKLAPGQLTTRGFIERDSFDAPPPAYISERDTRSAYVSASEPDARSVSGV